MLEIRHRFRLISYWTRLYHDDGAIDLPTITVSDSLAVHLSFTLQGSTIITVDENSPILRYTSPIADPDPTPYFDRRYDHDFYGRARPTDISIGAVEHLPPLPGRFTVM